MKTLKQKLSRLALPVVCATLALVAVQCRAQSLSPVGPVWDVVISGKANGIAFLSFQANGELCGIEIISPRSGGTSSPADARNTQESPPRSGSSTNSLSSTNVLYGFYPIRGWWAYDNTGRIIGSFPEIGSQTGSTTKEVVITNDFGVITTNTVADTDVVTVTNSVSFTAKVGSNGRLSMKGSSGIGALNYRGIPASQLPDVGGTWYGETKRGGQTFIEIIGLNPEVSNDCYLPYFTVCGEGPTYQFDGVALVSNQKRLALNTGWLGQTETVSRVVFGSLNSTTFRAALKGGEAPNYKVKLTINKFVGPAPPLPCDEGNDG
jgi:hypothetical protein